MRIGIHCLCTHPSYKGGTNSFTFGLLDGFTRVPTAHRFKIFATPGNSELFTRYTSVPQFEVVEISGIDRRRLRAIHRRLPSQVRRRVPLPSVDDVRNARQSEVLTREVDVLYVPYVPPPNFFPFPDVPTVYSIHDIQQVHFPEFFTPAEHRVREVGFGSTVEHATVIQASSRSMAREFCEHFPKLDASNVEVIPEGVDIELFSQPQAENDVIARYGLPESFLFLPAQLWPHKNHLTILRALKRLRDRGLVLPLVLTGGPYKAEQEILGFIESNGLGDQVFYLGLVPLEDVIALYQRARFLVTASLYESSSIPILEAAAAGTPILASRIPAHEEMAEHLEMRLFTPTDDAELAGLLEEAWSDERSSESQVAANRVAVRRYSWENAARLYVQLFERIQEEASAER